MRGQGNIDAKGITLSLSLSFYCLNSNGIALGTKCWWIDPYLKTSQRIRSICPNGTCVIFIECCYFNLVLLSSLIFRVMPMGSIKHDLSIIMNVTPHRESALLKLCKCTNINIYWFHETWFYIKILFNI